MIEFQKIRYKNFLPCGNSWSEITLNDCPTTLILGENGTGKSTILDALTFCLFGRPYRKIKKERLINSVNKHECVVEIEFATNGDQYCVRRGIKPNVFVVTKNGVDLESNSTIRDQQEHLENVILKLNLKSFTQLVILGSAGYIPFMQLAAADRRSLVEDIIDIQVFSTMNEILKKRISKTKEDISVTEQNIRSTTEAIELVEEAIQNLRDQASVEIDKKQNRIEEIESQESVLEKSIEDAVEKINSLLETISDDEEIEDKKSDYNTRVAKVKQRLKDLKDECGFFEENEECPTCGQSIELGFRQDTIAKKQQSIEKFEAGLETLREKIVLVEDRLQKVRTVKEKVSDVRINMASQKRELQMLRAEKKRVGEEIRAKDDTIVDKEIARLTTLKKRELENELARKTLSELKHLQDIAAVMLKDGGIKTSVIKQFLPHINQMINKYLSALNFDIRFTLNEMFEETIQSRHKENYEYASFSEGEKLRIDLAILFCWREIARLKNSMATNLLLLDEVVDSSLDFDGIDHFMKLLAELSRSSHVFVISHKSDMLSDRFDRTLTFARNGNFSKMTES